MALSLAARDVFIMVILISCMLTGAVGQDGACSETRRSTDLTGCLSEIRQTAENSSLFWFGSIAAEACPPYLRFTLNCFSLHQGVKTLAQLAFAVDNPDLSSINRYVDVKYSSAPGSYVGCDNTFTQSTTIDFTVDPLSSTAYTAWNLRSMPQVTWTADPADLFTLIVPDVGNGWLHGLYINIPGNNVSLGEAVKAYHGPRNSREQPNVYGFVLYKQASIISKSSIVLPPMTPVNVTDVATTYNFGELVGISWVLASYDAYAVDLQSKAGIMQNCADLVSKAYQSHPPRSFLPDPLDLSVFLRLHITQDATTYACGQERKALPAIDFFADPIGIPIISSAYARTETTRTFTMQMNKLFPNNTADFQGKWYSLAIVDSDIPPNLAFVGSDDLPLLHGLTINIQGDDFTSGTPLQHYFGPAPPDATRHIYYFLLYEQPGSLQLTSTAAYADQGQCSEIPRLKDRCQFNVTSFVSANDLKLVGATWLAGTNDEYTVCSNMPEGVNKAAALVTSILLSTATLLLTTLLI